jgi:hypothetical protein
MNSYKSLVKEAKNRIISNNYDVETQIKNLNVANMTLNINNKYLTPEEIYKYYKRVMELQSQETICCAVGILLDAKTLENLSPVEKERRVLIISKLYRALKSEYERNKDTQ